MKINIFSYGYWPEKFLINSLSTNLSKRNFVSVSTGIPNYPYGTFFEGYKFISPLLEKKDAVTIYRFPVFPRRKGFIFLLLNYVSNLFFGVLNIFRLPKSDINFVFATSPIFTAIPAIFHSKLYRSKTVIWLQDLWPESFLAITGFKKGSVIDRVLGGVVRWIYKNTDLILVQSEGFQENLDEYGYSGRVEWVPNWAASEKFKVSPSWVDEIPKDKFVITFAGNIGKAQGLETLLSAAEKLQGNSKLFFAIVGDGREKAILEKKYSYLNNVTFFGQKPVEDMMALFKASSALVVMLKKDPVFQQVIPSKFQTYMKASKPIITSLDGAGAELAKKYELGPVVEGENVEALVEKISLLLEQADEIIEKYGKNAYDLYKNNFESTKVQFRIEQLLEDLIK